jgi:hypothetical protein
VGVPVPAGRALAAGTRLPADFPYPAVLKPRWGAGSLGVALIPDLPAAAKTRAGSAGRLERFCPGVPASVSVLGGPAGWLPLVPCRQRLTSDGRFRYLGGRLPLPEPLAARALRLARAATAAIDPPCGYLGLDLVLGPNPEGRQDVVIEVNPRLTTSYVGLRAAEPDVNLAAVMLEVAGGCGRRLSFHPRSVEFDADGQVRCADSR